MEDGGEGFPSLLGVWWHQGLFLLRRNIAASSSLQVSPYYVAVPLRSSSLVPAPSSRTPRTLPCLEGQGTQARRVCVMLLDPRCDWVLAAIPCCCLTSPCTLMSLGKALGVQHQAVAMASTVSASLGLHLDLPGAMASQPCGQA